MPLVNTDGLVLIGPGSEWFWTAVSGLILAATFVAIYRQLRMQRAANAVEQIEEWSREAEKEEFHRAALEILFFLRDGGDPARVPDAAARAIGTLWERFGLMCRIGSRDPKVLWLLESDAAQGWWQMLEPRTRRRRAETGDATINESLEWLAGLMAKMDRRAGRPKLGWAYVEANLADWIESHQEMVDKAVAARTGPSPLPPVGSAEPRVADAAGSTAPAPGPADVGPDVADEVPAAS
jgi:hypothetical protein